jgi:hypothetical protein
MAYCASSTGRRAKAHRHRGQPHQRAVARLVARRRATVRHPRLLEALERLLYRVADVKAPPGAAEMAVPPPVHVALELIDGIEPPALDQALREAESHRRVVGPLPGVEAKRPSPDMSVIGSNVPGGRNSSVVPSASPTARPSMAPR